MHEQTDLGIHGQMSLWNHIIISDLVSVNGLVYL